jgi:Mn2+/Fe2+ NRAMP family transporter
MLNFAACFALFPVFSIILWWFRWPHPLSLSDKIFLGGFALISLPSGVLLVTAKSATPTDNQERLRGLDWVMVLVWVVLKILQIRPR